MNLTLRPDRMRQSLIVIILLGLCIASIGQTVTQQLYLSSGQVLNRISPVATGASTTYSVPFGVVVSASSSGSSANPGVATFTVAHTTPAGNNRLMLVGISQKNRTITSVTYGGTAMTLVGENISSTNGRMHLYSLLNPTVGTANVVVTLSSNPDRGIVVGVVTLNNVNQTTPLGTFSSASGTSLAANAIVSSAVGETVVDVATYRTNAMTVNASQSQLYNINSGGEIKGGGMSTKPGAASVTMNWNAAASGDWAVGAVSVKPANTTFTQSPVLCSDLIIKAGAVTVTGYVSSIVGSMPANPNITAVLRYGATNIISISNPVYNSIAGTLSWTGNVAADLTVPAGQAISMDVNDAQSGVSFNFDFGSQTKPSKIDFQTSSYVNVNSSNAYSATYPGGIILSNSVSGVTRYVRSVVNDPFGTTDITGVDVTITPTGLVSPAVQVATSGCTKTYEYTWTTPGSANTYTLNSKGKSGYENTVSNSKNALHTICVNCPPTAVDDSTGGPGGAAFIIDVLANDSDPNNNINTASLSIAIQPNNGNSVVENGKITYLPNGSFQGFDTLTYQICDNTSPVPLCATAKVVINVLLTPYSPCGESTKSRVYYMPYAEDQAQIALEKSYNATLPSTDIRTIISLKMPYPNMRIIWDQWEDGYETNILNPLQSSTLVWGDGNIFNGIAPGYPNDIIPAGGSIVLDNTMTTPRAAATFKFDGKDKIYASGQIAVTQVCGEPSAIALQCMKTNVSASPSDFGKSFTIPVGQNFNSRDFQYTALFLRAAENNTSVQIDRDNNGTFETTFTMNEGQVVLVDSTTAPTGISGILTGATVKSDKPIGVDVHWSGVDAYSSREVPVYPSTWYSNIYYTPTPTTGPGTTPKDTAVVMLYNSLNRSLNINWSSGVPSSGTITVPAKSVYRFPLPVSATAAFRFENPTGESFVAMEIYDSYTPGGGGNDGSTRDWSFNLLAEDRLTDFATIAWAPGSTDLSRNDNPIWVTTTLNTTLYVKYDGDVSTGPNTSPCGLKYDVSYTLNALNYLRILDNADNDQSGIALYTCNGAKLCAVYGEDASTAQVGNPSWDVGSTIQPFCKEKLIFANDDYEVTTINTPVNIKELSNDVGFLAVIDPATVTISGLLQPTHGSVYINPDGTLMYIPNNGFVGSDTFEYQVCSTPAVVCDIATVYITIGGCPTPAGQNIIGGQVYLDKNQDGLKNDGGTGFSQAKVWLYNDGNCSGVIDPNELIDSTYLDASGSYQFTRPPQKYYSDNFDGPGGTSSCASGTDGTGPWLSNWIDGVDVSVGFCVTPAQSAANTDVEIIQDGAFGYALRLDDKNVYAQRTLNMQNASTAYLGFSYRRAVNTLIAGEDVLVQLSSNGTTFNTLYTISGNGTSDAAYVNVDNIVITSYNTTGTTYIRFVTNANVDEGDYVFIDNVSVNLLKYNQCYITKVDPASLPANCMLTTTNLQTLTFVNASTCVTTADFGVKRISTFTVNDENSTWKDVNVSGSVLSNDYDMENNTQNFGSFLNPSTLATIATGSVVNGVDKTGALVANAGTITFDASGNYTFDPSPTFTGTVSIPYRLCDSGSPAACDSAFLVITVDPIPNTGVNTVIANNDENISYGEPVSNNLFVNDRDPQNDLFSVTNITGGTVGSTFTVSGIDQFGTVIANAGTLSVNANGSYTYTPAAGFYGNIKLPYSITDVPGAVSTATLYIEVLRDPNGPANDPPFAGDDFGYTTINKPVTANFISNDKEPNADQFSYGGVTIVTAGPHTAIGSPVATSKGGTVQFYADGTYTYTPPVGYTGPDNVNYTICDVTAVAPQPLCANARIHLLIGPGISISGKVWNDINGNIAMNGAEAGTNCGGTIYINLADASNNVVAVMLVNADGTYAFNNITPGVNYTIILSATQGVVGQPAPLATLYGGWINTGETRNGIIDGGSPGMIDSRNYGFTNTINYDLGIERVPTVTSVSQNIPQPTIGQQIMLNGGANPPVPSGNDAEDGAMGAGKTIVVTSLPTNTTLLYNGVAVVEDVPIPNFDPSLLKVQITPATVGTTSTIFQFNYVDAAGKQSLAPATYTLTWLIPLPLDLLSFTGKRAGKDNLLQWTTAQEMNSHHFEVEQRTDNSSFARIGTVAAKGNTVVQTDYGFTHFSPPLGVNYYRLKLVDIDGKFSYSKTIAIKNDGAAVTISSVYPNPFRDKIEVALSFAHAEKFTLNLYDDNGALTRTSTAMSTAGLNTISMSGLRNLAVGTYFLEIKSSEETVRTKLYKTY